MKSERHLTTIFCDDVRKEEGNKLSYMGVYKGLLAVPTLPTVLPGLCFALELRVTRDMIPLAELRFRICKDDEVLSESVVPAEALAATRSAAEAADIGDDRFSQFGTIFQMVPVPLEGPCFLRARAICDGEEVRGGSLAVVEQKDMAHALRGLAGLEASPFPQLERPTD